MICAAMHGYRLTPVVSALSDMPCGTTLAHVAPAYGQAAVIALVMLIDIARSLHGRAVVDRALETVASHMPGASLFAKAVLWAGCSERRDALSLALMRAHLTGDD
jgi:hypothetical protein